MKSSLTVPLKHLNWPTSEYVVVMAALCLGAVGFFDS